MSFNHPRARSVLLPALLAILADVVAPTPGGADPANPADWDLAIPARGVLDVAWAQGRLYGAVQLGGILASRPPLESLTPITAAGGLGSNRVMGLATAPDGSVWVGTQDAGITRLLADGSTRWITSLSGQLDVRTFAFTGNDTYYGGPFGAGRISSGQPERTFRSEDGLVSEDVRAVAARGGKAWFGTPAGVSEFDLQLNDLFTRNDGLGSVDVRALAVAGDRLYAGTATGLWVLDEAVDPPTWEQAQPVLTAEVLDLEARGDMLAVLATDRRVWWRSDPASDWSYARPGSDDQRFTSITIDDEGGLWLGGRRVSAAPIGNDITPLLAGLDGNESPYLRRLHGDQFYGLGTDREGGAWVGAFPIEAGVNHWRADGSIVAYDAEESGDAGSGFNHDGWLPNLKIDVLETRGGDVWVSAFQKGLTRMRPSAGDDPAAAEYLHVTPENSPLQMNRVFSMAEDPHGNLWFCAAGEVVTGDFNAGIDILTDPQAPFDEGSWLHIRPGNSQLEGEGFHRIAFEGDRAVWLTVRDLGLQRFVYGDGTGIDPASLDREESWRTVLALPHSAEENLDTAWDVAVGPDGRHWVATVGKGVFSFDYRNGPLVSARRYRAADFGAPLLSDDVYSVDVDRFGDAWVATAAGINRIRERGTEVSTAAFADLPHFLAYELGLDYSLQVLRPLPGGAPVVVEVSDSGSVLQAVTAFGAARVDLTPAREGGQEAAFDLYPNPVHADDGEVIVDGFEGNATFEIYDLQGRKIRSVEAEPGNRIWGLTTVAGEPVVNGLYLVRMRHAGATSTRVLAVER